MVEELIDILDIDEEIQLFVEDIYYWKRHQQILVYRLSTTDMNEYVGLGYQRSFLERENLN